MAETSGKPETTDALMIECNIDDMNPELYDSVMDRLFAAGAKEVYLNPVQMKKNRPGTTLSVMINPELRDKILSLIFQETSTGGVREYPVQQTMLERHFETVETPYGQVQLKKFYYQGECVSCKPEYDQIKKLADEHTVPMKQIYREIPC